MSDKITGALFDVFHELAPAEVAEQLARQFVAELGLVSRADALAEVRKELSTEEPQWYADDSPPGSSTDTFVDGVRFGLSLALEALDRLAEGVKDES